MIGGMADRFSYRFYGESALSGERHTIEGLRRWWERSFRLLPNVTFDVEEVVVAGGPWATRIAGRVRVHAPLPDGSSYDNVFMQNLHMRWAKITEIHTLEDTAVLQRTLDHLAELGVAEAHAEPITDTEPAPATGEHNRRDNTDQWVVSEDRHNSLPHIALSTTALKSAYSNSTFLSAHAGA
jgi:ketosteroid isomerase-like protein